MDIATLIDRNTFLLLIALYIVTRFLFRCWNRFMRHLNIRSEGWPPPHLDADGDFAPPPEPPEPEADKSTKP